MINVYIVSGFLGAGKTTFIQKLLKEKKFEKVMLLENEFGEIGVDSAFFDSGLKVKEINNGCICCSLQGDFAEALEEIEAMGVSDLIVEPSGVGKLSEIINTITEDEDFRIVSHICVVDVKTCQKYHKNFKEYFDDQVVSANAIILSHLDVADEEAVREAVKLVEEINDEAEITNRPLEEYPIEELLDIIVQGGEICPECVEEHHEGECHCHHHHDDDDDDEHEHHHHDHDEEDEHEHHHHHDDDDEDEIFKNVVFTPSYVFKKEELEEILSKMDEDIIRVKGYVHGEEGTLYFNYVLNEYHVYYGEKRDNTLVSVIGTVLDRETLKEVFHG
ncbi:MAG: GTP-binding protein [Erysipelotrichaceae bacterium]|nr:GTP-binding protein [Erysipelotrichaceae bacterium]